MLTLTTSERSLIINNYKLVSKLDTLAAKHLSLNGKMTVDTFNRRTGYSVTIPTLSCTDFATLKNIFQDQFDNSELVALTEDNTGISSGSFFMDLPDTTELRFTKDHVIGIMLEFSPENPDDLSGVS